MKRFGLWTLVVLFLMQGGCDDGSFEVFHESTSPDSSGGGGGGSAWGCFPLDLICLLFGASNSDFGLVLPPDGSSEATTTYPAADLSGETFVSPTDWTCCPADPGVEVVWSNETTGESGTAVSTVSGEELAAARTWTHQWRARVPLAPGANRLTVAAFDRSGHAVRKSLTVTRTR